MWSTYCVHMMLWNEGRNVVLLLAKAQDDDCPLLALFLIPRVTFLCTITLMVLAIPGTQRRLLYLSL